MTLVALMMKLKVMLTTFVCKKPKTTQRERMDYWFRVGPKSNMTIAPIGRETFGHRHIGEKVM